MSGSPAPPTSPGTPAPTPPKANATADSSASAPTLLRALGLAGWDHLESVVVAALATEAPLLLIGPHGTAKSYALGRIAEALGLAWRHYNASLINLDDLVGFPVPSDGRLVYLETPATIWQAEAVFIDEISRCRPELQNKLFPIVHERVVQGLPLSRLRHRWAAMNPPPPADVDAVRDCATYVGAEALDVALADRFAFVVPVPTFSELTVADREWVVRGSAGHGASHLRWHDALARVREALASARTVLRRAVPEYVVAVAQGLADAGHPISARRAAMLGRNIESLYAADLVLRPDARTEDAFFLALRYSLPDAAWGAPAGTGRLTAIHRAAWSVARMAAGDPLRAVLLEPDPFARLARALAAPLDGTVLGQVVADVFSTFSRPVRLATAPLLLRGLGARRDVPAAALEVLAEPCAAVARLDASSITVQRGGSDWKRDVLSGVLPALDATRDPEGVLRNTAIALLREDTPFEFHEVEAAYRRMKEALGTVRPPGRKRGRGEP